MFCALKIFAKLTNKSLIVRPRMTSFQNAMKWPQTTANFPYPSSSYNNNNNNNNISRHFKQHIVILVERAEGLLVHVRVSMMAPPLPYRLKFLKTKPVGAFHRQKWSSNSISALTAKGNGARKT